MHLNKLNRRNFLNKTISSLLILGLPTQSFGKSRFDAVVVGAGASGLSTTAELLKNGKSVLCVEAMNRIGGRCYTDNSIFGIPYDMGAHWLHNFSGNQIAKYGKKHKDIFNIYKDPDNSLIYEGQKKVNGFKLYNLYQKLEEHRHNIFTKNFSSNTNPANNIEDNKVMDVPFMNLIPQKLKDNELNKIINILQLIMKQFLPVFNKIIIINLKIT